MKRFAFIVEIAALYAFVCLMGWLFNGGHWSFPHVALHPFLIVVAVEANQYGLRPSLLAAGIGLLLYLVGSPGLSASDSLPMFAIMATGILLGLSQEARNRQLREARGEVAVARGEQDRLRQRISVLTQANAELNDRILGEVTTVSSFSELARRLSVLETADLYPAVCDLVNDYLSATRSTFYILQGSELRLAAARGFTVVPEELETIADKGSLAWLAVTEKGPVSALDLLERRKTDGHLHEGEYPILLAAPVLDEATGQVTGVLCVNNLPFAKFHGASRKILGVIARWAGDALHNATVVENLRRQISGPSA